MDNAFKKGMILGGMLSALAVGSVMSKPGQALAEDLRADAEALAADVKKRLAALQDVTKSVFDETVAAVIAEYAEQKKMAAAAKEHLAAAFEALWSEMEEESLSGT